MTNCRYEVVKEAVMGRETRLFKSEEQKTRKEVGAFLSQLADKVSEGKIILSQGEEDLTLEPSENVILEVQVENEEKSRRGLQHSLEIEIKWFDTEQPGPLKLK